jgi:hypothetical protein
VALAWRPKGAAGGNKAKIAKQQSENEEINVSVFSLFVFRFTARAGGTPAGTLRPEAEATLKSENQETALSSCSFFFASLAFP